MSDYTGFPEILGGRFNALESKVHVGILGYGDLPEHVATLEKHDISAIDFAYFLYYFFIL